MCAAARKFSPSCRLSQLRSCKIAAAQLAPAGGSVYFWATAHISPKIPVPSRINLRAAGRLSSPISGRPGAGIPGDQAPFPRRRCAETPRMMGLPATIPRRQTSLLTGEKKNLTQTEPLAFRAAVWRL
jgi:hypothetical protein